MQKQIEFKISSKNNDYDEKRNELHVKYHIYWKLSHTVLTTGCLKRLEIQLTAHLLEIIYVLD